MSPELRDVLATAIDKAVCCECSHRILDHHVNKCNYRGEDNPALNEVGRLRQAIWGPECACAKSDSEALADFLLAAGWGPRVVFNGR